MTGSAIARLIDWLRGYGSRLDAHEMAIIEAVARKLSPTDAEKLRCRARAINRVQRLFGGTETTLYEMRRGKPVFPSETAIIREPRSARFARFAVRSSDQLSRLKGTVFLHEGNLSSIDFDRPTKFAEAAHMDEIKVTMLGPPFADPDAEEWAAGDWPAPGGPGTDHECW